MYLTNDGLSIPVYCIYKNVNTTTHYIRNTTHYI